MAAYSNRSIQHRTNMLVASARDMVAVAKLKPGTVPDGAVTTTYFKFSKVKQKEKRYGEKFIVDGRNIRTPAPMSLRSSSSR